MAGVNGRGMGRGPGLGTLRQELRPGLKRLELRRCQDEFLGGRGLQGLNPQDQGARQNQREQPNRPGSCRLMRESIHVHRAPKPLNRRGMRTCTLKVGRELEIRWLRSDLSPRTVERIMRSLAFLSTSKVKAASQTNPDNGFLSARTPSFALISGLVLSVPARAPGPLNGVSRGGIVAMESLFASDLKRFRTIHA